MDERFASLDAAVGSDPTPPFPATPVRRRRSRPTAVSPYFKSSPDRVSSSPSQAYGPGDGSQALSVHGIPRSPHFFGLVQEVLVRPGGDPLATTLRLLIVTCLLNQTTGRQAVPLFWKLIIKWPTAESLRDADLAELTAFLQPIGLHRVRAARLIQLGKVFCENPPRPGVLYRTRGEKEGAWTSIGHLPSVGRYASDSFRIFCVRGGAQRALPTRPRADQLDRALEVIQACQTRATSLQPSASSALPFGKVPKPHLVEGVSADALHLDYGGADVLGQNVGVDEWKRVMPRDKELRAYLVWRWSLDGIKWCPERGVLADAQ